MERTTQFARIAVFCSVLLFYAIGPSFAQFHSDLAKATLSFDGKSSHAMNLQIPALEEHVVGTHRIYLDGDKVECYSADNYHQWTISTSDKHDLEWMGCGKSTAYLAEYTNEPNGDPAFDMPFHVRRLDLQHGRWLADLPLPIHGPRPSNSVDIVATVLAGPNAVIVLSGLVKPDIIHDPIPVSYSVSAYQPQTAKLLWSKSFLAGVVRDPWADLSLWTPHTAFTQSSNLQPLVWLDSGHVLVCAGSTQDLLCLSLAAGDVTCRLSKIWEYQEGFIGPSVYSFYIGRFGQQPFPPDHNQAAEEKEFDSRYTCELIAGPVVVRASNRPSIFVAVSRRPIPPPSDYTRSPAECILYEFGPQPISMVTLPRFVVGSQFTVHGQSVIWGCEGEAAIRISASVPMQIAQGPGSPDLVSDIDWYRQYRQTFSDVWHFGWGQASHQPWLVALPRTDAAAFGNRFFCRIHFGGYVLTKNSHEYDFPIDVIDYGSGVARTATLHVPFSGKIPFPKTNYAGDQSGFTTFDGYELWIDDISFDGPRLRVVLSADSKTEAAEFNLGSVR